MTKYLTTRNLISLSNCELADRGQSYEVKKEREKKKGKNRKLARLLSPLGSATKNSVKSILIFILIMA